jgi:hypothetical protein
MRMGKRKYECERILTAPVVFPGLFHVSLSVPTQQTPDPH